MAGEYVQSHKTREYAITFGEPLNLNTQQSRIYLAVPNLVKSQTQRVAMTASPMKSQLLKKQQTAEERNLNSIIARQQR